MPESETPCHSPEKGVSAGLEDELPSRGVWEQTFDALDEPVSIVDANFHVLAANAAYRRAFGLEDGIPAGHPCFASGGGGFQPCEGCPLMATIEAGEPHMTRQERLAPADRGGGESAGRWERRVYERWTYPLVEEDGSVSRAVEVIRDVTERERLASMSIKAEAYRLADQLKTELLGAVSHELRSPLATIRGYADTLAHHDARLTPHERREFLRAISEASERLSAEVERLLLYSRLEAGDVSLDMAPVDIARVAHESARAAQARAPRHQRLSVAELDEGPHIVVGDARRLREALDALVDNAIAYAAEPGEVSVTVGSATIQVGDGQRPAIQVVVRDSGRGIPTENLPHIFEAFHRVENGLTRAVEGIGLGLALCKRIVTMSGGDVLVSSAPGAGCAFTITLPAAVEASPGREKVAHTGRQRRRP